LDTTSFNHGPGHRRHFGSKAYPRTPGHGIPDRLEVFGEERIAEYILSVDTDPGSTGIGDVNNDTSGENMTKGIKVGLDYFSIDVDIYSDEKLQFIIAKFPVGGEAVLLRLLSRIYRQGYYYQWDEDQCWLLSMAMGGMATPTFIQDVVKEASHRKFFHPEMLEDYNILTSRRIQKHYLLSAWRRKRVDVINEFILIDIHDDKYSKVNVNIIDLNADIYTTRKGKERKGKDSKGKDSKEKKTPKTPTQKLTLTEVQLSLIEFLKDRITENNPDYLPSSNYKQSWGKDLDKMMRLDKRTPERIREVIDWCQSSDFWKPNIQSFKKLRDKFNILTSQMRTNNHGGNNGNSNHDKHADGF
jgi:Lin1244/Lin1753-like, N-terminal